MPAAYLDVDPRLEDGEVLGGIAAELGPSIAWPVRSSPERLDVLLLTMRDAVGDDDVERLQRRYANRTQTAAAPVTHVHVPPRAPVKREVVRDEVTGEIVGSVEVPVEAA